MVAFSVEARIDVVADQRGRDDHAHEQHRFAVGVASACSIW